MTLNEYQQIADLTAGYPNKGHNLPYTTLGLCGESGEVAEKVKKLMRDDFGVLTDERREAIANELGDVLWYLQATAMELGYTLEQIAQINVFKLSTRARRNKISGEGDNR